MNDNNTDTVIDEGFSRYNPSGQQNYTAIILAHVRLCAMKLARAWHGGYFRERIIMVGDNALKSKEWISDTREEFIHAVWGLHDLCSPHFDPQAKKEISQFNTTLANKKNITSDEEANTYRQLYRILCELIARKDFFRSESAEVIA